MHVPTPLGSPRQAPLWLRPLRAVRARWRLGALAIFAVLVASSLAYAQAPGPGAAAPAVAATGTVAAPPAALTLDALVDRIHGTYRATQDLAATFEQTYRFKVTGRAKRSAGRVFLKLPGKMRWDYLEPEPKHFIADGSNLWVVAPEDRQVMRQTLGKSDLSQVLGFLMGSGDLREQFTLEQLPADAAGRYRLRLVPKTAQTHYREVVLVVDPTTFRTVETEITDPAGNLNHLVFQGIVVNQGLPDGGFVFEVPPGFRVIDAGRPSMEPTPAPAEEPDDPAAEF